MLLGCSWASVHFIMAVPRAPLMAVLLLCTPRGGSAFCASCDPRTELGVYAYRYEGTHNCTLPLYEESHDSIGHLIWRSDGGRTASAAYYYNYNGNIVAEPPAVTMSGTYNVTFEVADVRWCSGADECEDQRHACDACVATETGSEKYNCYGLRNCDGFDDGGCRAKLALAFIWIPLMFLCACCCSCAAIAYLCRHPASASRREHPVQLQPSGTPFINGPPIVQVTVPPGVTPGTVLHVQTPSGVMAVEVPVGVAAGQIMQIQAPPAAQGQLVPVQAPAVIQGQLMPAQGGKVPLQP